MNIQITQTKTPADKQRIHGETVYMDAKFTFTVHVASASKDYSHVLRLAIISPSTNKILQMSGRTKKNYIKRQQDKLTCLESSLAALDPNSVEYQTKSKQKEATIKMLQDLSSGKRLDVLNCQQEVYLQKCDDRTIRKAVNQAVPQLFGKFQNEIAAGLKQAASTESLHALTAFTLYSDDFFSTQNKMAEKTLKGKQGALRKVCTALNHKAICDLTPTDIEKAMRFVGKNPIQKLKLAEKFLDFCGKSQLYQGTNPITLYLASQGRTRKMVSKRTRIHPATPIYLSSKNELMLHQLLEHDLNTNLGLAIPLVKGCRMSMDRLLEITWGELQINGDQIQIPEFKDNFTGATLNYIHPPLGETAYFLLKKRAHLSQTLTPTKLNKTRLVPLSGTVKEQKAALTKHFRDTLRESGVNADLIGQSVDPNNPKATGGAGYSFLCRHYDHVLQDRCGVELNSGVGAFLRGMRIHDTTTDSYRALSDDTGNHFLQTIARRDQFFFSTGKQPPAIAVAEEDDDYITYTISAEDCAQILGVQSKAPIFLPKGSELTMEGDYGVGGIITFSTEKKDSLMLYPHPINLY